MRPITRGEFLAAVIGAAAVPSEAAVPSDPSGKVVYLDGIRIKGVSMGMLDSGILLDADATSSLPLR